MSPGSRLLALALLPGVALAQNAPPPAAEAEKKGSITGMVRRAGTDTPIAGVLVSVYTNTRYSNGRGFMSAGNTKEIKTATDEQGHYLLNSVPAGIYRVFARTLQRHNVQEAGRMVKLGAGEDLSSIDVFFPSEGSITGRVLDHNDEPIRGADVFLVYREYLGGRVEQFIRTIATTNDTGEYTFAHVEAERPYFLVTRGRPLSKGTEMPADPAFRKPIPVPTYFPNSTSSAGAVPITLRSEERREAVDFVVRRAPSFCISGIVESSGEGSATLLIAGGEISSDGGGVSSTAAFFRADADGKFHACGLTAGDYRILATFQKPFDRETPAKVGWSRITITKEDVMGLRLFALPGVRVTGRVEWDGPAPDPPLTVKATIGLWPRGRDSMTGEEDFARSSIPGEFVLPHVFIGDYAVLPSAHAPGVYVKDMFYGANRVLRDPLRINGGAGELRVVLARDGGTIAVKVADKDGKSVPDIKVVIMAAVVRSEADLPEMWALGETDQDGNYSYGPLPPGKYLVFATTARVDRSVESVAKVWGARSRLEPVELGPNSQIQVNLTPIVVD